MTNQIRVFSAHERFHQLEGKIIRAIKKTLSFLKKQGLVLEVYLVGDRIMRKLNLKFKKKNKTTNVLSFPALSPLIFREPKLDRRFNHLGEIYLNPDYISRKQENLEAMLIHGLLHLLGFDHKNKFQAAKMERLEEKLLDKL